jgi:acetyl-CoA carboxylase, biotin carboxylase subunit
MFKKVLIANRGEIAVRCIKACHDLGISTVGVYTEKDDNSLHKLLSDEIVQITDYLDEREILLAAKNTKSDAIFPGYGFLSENSHFAKSCNRHFKWIGPSHSAINSMGDKAKARKIMIASGIPIVPGSNGSITSHKKAVSIADSIGYPIMIKAVAGGGGRGMAIVKDSSEFVSTFQKVQNEAKIYFNNDLMYLEKYIMNPKHIELQIIGDNYGNIIHLGNRECSVQRRHQKMIEEGLSPSLDERISESISKIAVRAAQKVKYSGAGTFEFIYDGKNLYFIEMNTRIQVEHPITEMLTGVDIVKEMIRVAAGEELSYSQRDIGFKGHVIECRINAEDPSNDFIPSPGTITKLVVPRGEGIRIDSALYQGCTISEHYDSLISKVICHAQDRESSINLMRKTLSNYSIEGVTTNISFHQRLLNQPEFIDGSYTTSFIENLFQQDKLKELNEINALQEKHRWNLLTKLSQSGVVNTMIEYAIRKGHSDIIP